MCEGEKEGYLASDDEGSNGAPEVARRHPSSQHRAGLEFLEGLGRGSGGRSSGGSSSSIIVIVAGQVDLGGSGGSAGMGRGERGTRERQRQGIERQRQRQTRRAQGEGTGTTEESGGGKRVGEEQARQSVRQSHGPRLQNPKLKQSRELLQRGGGRRGFTT